MMSMVWNNSDPFQALALTGGGYRGLFTAKALAVMEAETGAPLGRCFDLVCGTSIGGIVALALAFEIPMQKVVTVFEAHGLEIFPPHRRAPSGFLSQMIDFTRHSHKARYEAASLREVIAKLIPEKAILGDALHAVAIPAVNLSEGKPQVFKTRHIESWNRDWKLNAIDIAMATSAAPTFFELADIKGQLYADGGLFANAPDLIALHEAEHFFSVPPEAFRLLSIGTTTKKYSVSYKKGRDFGVLDWMEGQRLFSVIISAQQQFVDQIVSHRLGERYLRVDSEPSNEQASDLGLDIASEEAKKALLALAEKTVTDILGTALVPYLSHKSRMKIHREQ